MVLEKGKIYNKNQCCVAVKKLARSISFPVSFLNHRGFLLQILLCAEGFETEDSLLLFVGDVFLEARG